MAVIESTTGTAMAVDPGFAAARMTLRPPETLGWNSVGALSGALAGVAANGALFSLRNASAQPILVRRFGLGFMTTTAFTAAQALNWGLFFARSFTASDGGGTAIAFIGSNTKHRTSLATPTSLDCRMATTAALSAGVRALDANALAVLGAWSAGQGTTLQAAPSNLFSQDTGDHPLVLGQNEGLVLVNLTAMGAGGAGTLHVNLEFAEAGAY